MTHSNTLPRTLAISAVVFGATTVAAAFALDKVTYQLD